MYHNLFITQKLSIHTESAGKRIFVSKGLKQRERERERESERKQGRESERMNECIHKRAGEIRRKN